MAGHQLRPPWCPCSHVWHCCSQLVHYSAGNGSGCCQHPLRGRHSWRYLKVAAHIATPSYAEILQRSAYMAIGVVTNLYMCMKASLQSCPFQSWPHIYVHLPSQLQRCPSHCASWMDSAENFVCCWTFCQGSEESQSVVYHEGMMEYSSCNFCIVTSADNSSRDTSACSMGDNSQPGEW